MNKRDFYRQFRALLPDSISETSINLENPEFTTLMFVGVIISRMTDEAQMFYDNCEQESGICDSFDDLLVGIVANRYQIEW